MKLLAIFVVKYCPTDLISPYKLMNIEFNLAEDLMSHRSLLRTRNQVILTFKTLTRYIGLHQVTINSSAWYLDLISNRLCFPWQHTDLPVFSFMGTW